MDGSDGLFVPQHVALCGGAVGAGGGGAGLPTTLGVPGVMEIVPLALLAALFVGLGVWMFRRFGNSARRAGTGEAKLAGTPAEEPVRDPKPALEGRERPAAVPRPGVLGA